MQIVIDLTEYRSITRDLKNYIIENRIDFTKVCMTHFIDKYQLYASLNDDIIDEHKNALNELLINKYIVAAHYSRVENIELIKSEGLHLLNKDKYVQRLMKIANRSDCNRKERNEFEQYLYNFEKYNSGPREGLLSFVYPSNTGESCNRFTTAIGGEIIANAEDECPNIYQFLSTVGTPIKLIAKVPFADVNIIYKEKFICKLISYVLSRELENKSSTYWLEDELRIEKKLDASNIIYIEEL